MTDTPTNPQEEAKAGHSFMRWVRRWATHPTVLLAARVSVAGLAFGLGTAATYVVSIDGKVGAVDTKLNSALISISGKFETIGSVIDAMGDRMDNGRDDRLRFQADALEALNKLVDGQATVQATIAAQFERSKAIEDRLTRIERKID